MNTTATIALARLHVGHASLLDAIHHLTLLADADRPARCGWLVRELHAAGTPHLLVRVRDGTGLVGPMVVPGVTSCLGSH